MARGIQISTSKISTVATLEEAYIIYIKKCQIKNLSERTIKYYKETISSFIDWAHNPLVTALNEELLDEYILYRRGRGNSNNYINSQLRQLRAFISFIIEKYDIKKFKVKLIKIDEENKEPYTDAELKILLEAPTSTNFIEWRDWAMTNFFVATGARLGTVVNLKVRDIDFTNKMIFLAKLKNRKQQYIPLSEKLEKVLKIYMGLWGAQENDFLFPTYERGQLQDRSAQDSLTRYNHSRGVTTTGVHRFRHTFAKNYILNGGQPFQLQKILGHSTLDMTLKYVRLYSIDLQCNFDKFCPLDNL